MSTRRSKLDIQLEVLKAVRAGVDKPTRIIYAVNMSWKPVRKMIDNIVVRGLISVITDTGGNVTKRRYEITEKDVSAITYLEGAKELVDIK